jgi:peptidoglycan/xylan/chitin deacetylase (PgdA/CDA1 family)
MSRLVAVLVVLCACASSPPGPAASRGETRVAVTVDDLPRHGPEAPGQDRLALHRALLDALGRHRVPQVYGFVNSGRARPEDRAALEAWVAAGYPLGNHTAHHPELKTVGRDAYLADVDAGEPLLAELLGQGKERVWKVFRYPYLAQGTDVASRLALRQALVERHYRIAEVTIDFDDWAYNPTYVRCLRRGDTASTEALESMLLDAAVSQLRWADDTLRRLTGRPVPHVLLLHAGAFDAHVLDRLLSAYEKEGVRWIPLDEALADPVYTHEPDPPRSWRADLPSQMIRSRQLQGFTFTASPAPLLERLCLDANAAAARPDP